MVDVSSQCSVLHFLVSGTDPSVTDVLTDVVIKENSILRDHPNERTKRALFHLRTKTQIQAVYKIVHKDNSDLDILFI